MHMDLYINCVTVVGMQQAQIGQRLTFASCLQAELGYNMHLLDIGGGFPGSEYVKLKFEDVCFLFT